MQTAKSRIKIDMQITYSVVCDTSKHGIYKQIKQPLDVEHAFPLTEFVCETARVIPASYSLLQHISSSDKINIFICYQLVLSHVAAVNKMSPCT